MLNPLEMSSLMTDSDVVFHSAAFVAVEKIQEDLMRKINVEGTRSIATAAIESGVEKLIYFSSVHAFEQHPTSDSLVESRPLVTDPKALPYDRTKAEAQKLALGAREQGLAVNVVHPTGIIGPYDFKPSRMGNVLQDVANGKMPFAINNGFNWVDVRDVAKSAVNCVDKGIDGQNYIIPGHWASMPHLSTLVKQITGRRTHLLTVPFWMGYIALPFASISSKITGKRPSVSKGSLQALAIQCRDIPGNLARDHLAHNPRKIEETISDTVSWLTDKNKVVNR
tara:strand:- start:3307 stop:4149 length:843 start_codon:yes stop_codon:yes gene_type:complete